MGFLIMIQYLAIIRKSDFIDLFKYGHLFVHHAMTFDGKFEEHKNDKRLFEFLTAKMNPYEYSFEYLMILLQQEYYKGASFEINISDVLSIYAFNEIAKKEMSISFDPRIQIHVSPWSTWFDKLQKDQFIKQSMRGIDNLWGIFNLTEENKKYCQRHIEGDVISEVFRELFANERPVGEHSLWTYLLRYERHSLYPRNLKGFFCDFIHVVCNWRANKEQLGDVAETTQVYQVLSGTQFHEFVNVVCNSPLHKMTEDATGCNFCVVAPLFLFLKSVFCNGIDIRVSYNGTPILKIINYLKNDHSVEFALAIYLLGVTLGFDKTYDAYYDAIELPIFKKKVISHVVASKMNNDSKPEPHQKAQESNSKEESKPTELKEPSTLKKESNNNIQPSKNKTTESLFPLSDMATDEPLAYFYKKGTRGKNQILIPVFTQEELLKYKNDKTYSKKNK